MSVVYFIDDGNSVRIGEAKNFKKRLRQHESSRGKESTKVVGLLPVRDKERKDEEEIAFKYFQKYRLPNDTKSFYSREILSMISDYITERQLTKQGIEKQLEKRIGTTQTVYGEENLSIFREWCDIFPHQKVCILGKAGTKLGERPRKFTFEGKDYFVGPKAKDLCQMIIRDTKIKYRPIIEKQVRDKIEKQIRK